MAPLAGQWMLFLWRSLLGERVWYRLYSLLYGFLCFFFLALSIVPQELCSGCACSRILEEILGASFVLSDNLAASGC